MPSRFVCWLAVLSLSGCPEPGYGPHSWLEPSTPQIGAHFTLHFSGPLYGYAPVRDGDVIEVFVNTTESPSAPPAAPRSPTPRDSGVKLGEIIVQGGTGTLELELQSAYGPDKYGNSAHVDAENFVELRIQGRTSTQTIGISVWPKQQAVPG